MGMMQLLLGSGGGIFATGGVITTSGDYRIHTFTSSGTLTVTSAPVGSTVEYLVVAGGGEGGLGGGGAGGMRTGTLSIITSAYPVTVGAGGAGNGSDSIFSTITSTGGGRGGHVTVGVNGGSINETACVLTAANFIIQSNPQYRSN